jgi:hypothetical protein
MPIAVPRFLAAQSKPGKGGTLVLTDITECGAIPGNPGDALTPEQAALVVKQLARFHAHFWNKVDLLQTYYWLAGPVRRLEDYLVFLIGNSFVLATGSATSLISWPQLSNRRSGGSMKRIFWQFMFRISRITASQALIQKLSCRDTALTLLIPSKQ